MAYTITLTDGTTFATIADGTINTSSSMTLVGKNYAGYGQFLDQNYIRLLENASNTSAPGSPLTGQLWWDKTNSVMKAYNGTTWKTISSATASATAPTSNVTGDLWWDTTNNQLRAYNGSSFTLVGPASGGNAGTTGAVVISTSASSVAKYITGLYSANVLVGTVSSYSTFTPDAAITGFATISPGIQLSSTVSDAKFQGTLTLNATTTQGTAASISVGGNGSNTSARLECYGITNLGTSGTGNIGSAGAAFDTIFATATEALYADVAERFAADEALQPGTVVELGGVAEITKSSSELSENVFGVISTRAAYLMNGGAGTNETHPPVAMTGRVPVLVTGVVNKGDRLVSAGNGRARAAQPGEATAFNVIGRALTSKATSGEGTVEAIVTIK